MKKKILITLLSAILVITMMPLAVFGADSSTSRSVSSFSGGQRQRIALGSTVKTGDVLAKIEGYSAEQFQLAAIPFEDIEKLALANDSQASTLRNIIGDLELDETLTSRDVAARVQLRDMLSDGVVPVVDQDFYFQIVFADGAECEPYITTAGNQQKVLFKTAKLHRFERELAEHYIADFDEPTYIIDRNVALESLGADASRVVYLLPGALAYQSDEIRVDLLEAAKKGKFELHVADAEVALLEQAESKLVPAENVEVAVRTLIDEGKVVVDAEQAEAYASSFGSGNTILIYVCTGILVAACITAVVIARRKEKSR